MVGDRVCVRACAVCAHRELRRVGVVIPFPWAFATTTAKTGRGFVPPVLLLSVRVDKGRGADQGRTCTNVCCVLVCCLAALGSNWLHCCVCVRAVARTCEGLHGHHVHKTRTRKYRIQVKCTRPHSTQLGIQTGGLRAGLSLSAARLAVSVASSRPLE